jgi:hypothetical protein
MKELFKFPETNNYPKQIDEKLLVVDKFDIKNAI